MDRAGDAAAQAVLEMAAEWERREVERAAALGVTVGELVARELAEQEARRSALGAALGQAAAQLAEARTRRLLSVDARDLDAIFTGRHRMTEAIGVTDRWRRSSVPVLVLCGGVGTGKTIAALGAAHAAEQVALSRMVSAHLTPVDSSEHLERALAELRRTRPRVDATTAAMLGKRVDPWKADTEAGIRPLRMDAALVVLDDLGTERADDARFHDALFRLIDERQDAGTRTLITTNLARADIRPRYGDRIADRLNHVGIAVEIRGASMRRPGAL